MATTQRSLLAEMEDSASRLSRCGIQTPCMHETLERHFCGGTSHRVLRVACGTDHFGPQGCFEQHEPKKEVQALAILLPCAPWMQLCKGFLRLGSSSRALLR